MNINCGKLVSLFSLVAFMCVCCNAMAKDSPVVLAEGGKACAFILTDTADKSPAITQAVKDLKKYLGEISGAEFASGSSLPGGYSGNVIIVGRLTPKIVKKFGLDSRDVPKLKGSVMITAGNELLLAGSDDFGVVMSVYNFLENVLDVHWWTPWEQSVPKMERIEVSELDLIDQPTFTLGNEIEPNLPTYSKLWAFRNRFSNAQLGDMPAEELSQLQGPQPCSSLDSVLPMAMRQRNKKSTALINAKRTPQSKGLCWTYPSLQNFIAKKELLLIDKTQMMCKKQHVPAPLFYYLGPDAGCAWCQCGECAKVKTLDESNAGPVLELVNAVAAKVEKKYPDLLLAMPASQAARAVPQKTKPADNVMIVWFNQNMKITRPMVDKLNTTARTEFEAWTKIAKNIGVFYYGNADGYGDGLGGANGGGWPESTLYAFDKNLKYFKRFNAKYFHLKCRADVFSDMPDLKLWMASRMMLDVNRSSERELQTFMKGFYGPAGKYVRKYLSELQRFVQITPGNVWYLGELPEYTFLTTEFLVLANGIWQQAADAVKDDVVLSQRVAAGRLSIDRAILALWPELVRQWLLESPKNTVDDIPLDRSKVLARYEKTMQQELSRRGEGLDERANLMYKMKFASELEAFKRNVYVTVKPASPVFGAKPEQIFDYPAGGVNYVVASGVKVVGDDTAETGRAYCVEKDMTVEEPAPQFDSNVGYRGEQEDLKFETAYELPLIWGVQYKFSGRSKPSGKLSADLIKYNGPGYHWYKLGRVGLGGNAYVYLFESRAVRIYFRQVGTFDLWVRMKIVAPEVTAEADTQGKIFIDRVTLVRP